MYRSRRARRILIILAIGGTVGACALVDPPSAQIDVARTAIAAAEAAGAGEHASAELAGARAKLADAEERVRRGDYVGAERRAEAAEADARLAAMKARARRAGASNSGDAQ